MRTSCECVTLLRKHYLARIQTSVRGQLILAIGLRLLGSQFDLRLLNSAFKVLRHHAIGVSREHLRMLDGEPKERAERKKTERHWNAKLQHGAYDRGGAGCCPPKREPTVGR